MKPLPIPVNRGVDLLQRDIQALRTEVALLRGSTSWRLTSPLRAVGRLIKGRGDR